MKEVDGLLNAKRPKKPDPKPSAKDFVWPSQADHDDKVAQKIAASLQELLPAKEWNHGDLARFLWGVGKTGQARNIGATRRYLTAEHPIPNEQTAGYIAQLLDVPMQRLLEPQGKFDPFPSMIRERKDSKRNKKNKKGPTPEQVAKWNKAYRERQKAKANGTGKRKYTKRAHTNGDGEVEAESNGSGWVLAKGVPVPEYTFESNEEHPGHLKITINAVMPHPRAMTLLHMLEYQAAEE